MLLIFWKLFKNFNLVEAWVASVVSGSVKAHKLGPCVGHRAFCVPGAWIGFFFRPTVKSVSGIF